MNACGFDAYDGAVLSGFPTRIVASTVGTD
jgi:hypothetical protein